MNRTRIVTRVCALVIMLPFFVACSWEKWSDELSYDSNIQGETDVSGDNVDNPAEEDDGPYFVNNPLPLKQGSLKILAIGNSYTDDATAYMGDIICHSEANITPEDFCIYSLTNSGATLDLWTNRLENEDVVETVLCAGGLQMDVSEGTLPELLAQDWDVVVLQQVSYWAPQYETYNPSLCRMIDAIAELCTNKQVSVAWNLVPAYGKNYVQNENLVGRDRWAAICKATKMMERKVGIDLIIPTGTAIENARLTSLNNAYDLTRDDIHICFGAGRYISALTWIGALFCPVFGVELEAFTYIAPLKAWELSGEGIASFYPGSTVPVDDTNRELCLSCASWALTDPFSTQLFYESVCQQTQCTAVHRASQQSWPR